MKRLVTSPIILAPLYKRLLTSLGVVGFLLGLAGNAGAQPAYGDELKSFADADVKLCFACHDSVNGGGSKGQKFYSTTLKAAGWQGGSGLGDALDKVKSDGTDTDDDGVDDITELAAGSNPSDADDTPGGGAGGSGGSGGNNAGRGGSGGGGGGGRKSGGGDGDNDNEGKQDQATSAGCSYGSLDGSSRAGSLAILTGAALAVSSFTRRRKRR